MQTYQQQIEAKVAESGEIIRWLITLAVSIGALLEVIDTSIVNVALPYIRANLGATLSEAAWVITAYAIANAVMIPLTAWLGGIFGRKVYFIFSLIGFTVASVACGCSINLPMLVIARVVQGLCGGGLLAKAQAILFETFPREKQGFAQGIFGICVIVGPVLGPTIGGYLTDLVNWRWIFLINIPVGILAVLMCWIALPMDRGKWQPQVDWIGILLLTVALGSFQYVLEKGQEDDWFSSRLIVGLTLSSIISAVLFVLQETRCKYPAVDFAVLRHRSVSAGVAYSLILGMGLYGISFVVPIYAQNILDFTAAQTGLLLMPGALASGFMMPLVGNFTGKFDSRLQIALGGFFTALSAFALTSVNINTGADDFFWPLLLRGVAIVLMYMPLTISTLGECPVHEIASASAFTNLARQFGGSIGIAGMTTLLARREDFHRLVLVEKLTPYHSGTMERLQQLQSIFHYQGASLHDAGTKAIVALNGLVNLQSTILSYEDIFWTVGMMFIVSLPLVLLLSKGRAGRTVSAH